MRRIRTRASQQRDEQLGILSPRPLIPEIARRSTRRILSPITVHNEPMSFGYVSWIAFLVFWLVFGWAYISFEMTTSVFSSTQGLSIRLQEQDPYPDETVVYRVEAAERRNLTIDGVVWDQFQKARLCREHPETSTFPVLVVAVPANESYQSFVTALERVLLTADQHGCRPSIQTTTVAVVPSN